MVLKPHRDSSLDGVEKKMSSSSLRSEMTMGSSETDNQGRQQRKVYQQRFRAPLKANNRTNLRPIALSLNNNEPSLADKNQPHFRDNSNDIQDLSKYETKSSIVNSNAFRDVDFPPLNPILEQYYKSSKEYSPSHNIKDYDSTANYRYGTNKADFDTNEISIYEAFEKARDTYYSYGHLRGLLVNSNSNSEKNGSGIVDSKSVKELENALNSMNNFNLDAAQIQSMMLTNQNKFQADVSDLSVNNNEANYNKSNVNDKPSTGISSRPPSGLNKAYSLESLGPNKTGISMCNVKSNVVGGKRSTENYINNGSYAYIDENINTPANEYPSNLTYVNIIKPIKESNDTVSNNVPNKSDYFNGVNRIDQTSDSSIVKARAKSISNINLIKKPEVPQRPENLIPEVVQKQEVDKDRAIWQAMLSSVLSGEVLRTETSRFSITTIDDHDRNYRIWLEIRAYIRGKSVPEELQRIKEQKLDADNIFQNLLSFKAEEGNEYSSVKAMLDKVESIESLYPNLKLLIADNPIYESTEFKARLSALYSWILLTNIVRNQLEILGKDEMKYDPKTESRLNEKIGKTSPLIEYVKGSLEHVDVQKSYREGALCLIIKLIKKIRTILEESHSNWKLIGLHASEKDIMKLISYVPSFIQGVMELRLGTAEKYHFSGTGLDAFIDDFSSLFDLGVMAKKTFLELGMPSKTWTFGTGITPDYEKVLSRYFKCYFDLIMWRLKSGTELAFCKEIDVIDIEWNFSRNVAGFIDSGDIECARRIIDLVVELLMKMHSLVDKSNVVSFEIGQTEEIDKSIKSVSRVLEVLKERIKKVISFYKTFSGQFSNSVEFSWDPSYLQQLANDGFVSLRCEHFSNVFVLAAPKTSVETAVHCLTRAFGDKKDGHILIIPAKNIWPGRNINIRIDNPIKINLKPDCLRLVDSDGTHIPAIKAYYQNAYRFRPVSSLRPNLESIHLGLKSFRRMILKVTDSLIQTTINIEKASLKLINETKAILNDNDKLRELDIDKSFKANNDILESKRVVLSSTLYSCISITEDMFSFTSNTSFQVALVKPTGKKYIRTIQQIVELSLEWGNFIFAVREDIPHDKLILWAVNALQFIMTATAGQRINALAANDFQSLKENVSKCMTILLDSFNGNKQTLGLVVDNELPLSSLSMPTTPSTMTPTSPNVPSQQDDNSNSRSFNNGSGYKDSKSSSTESLNQTKKHKKIGNDMIGARSTSPAVSMNGKNDKLSFDPDVDVSVDIDGGMLIKHSTKKPSENISEEKAFVKEKRAGYSGTNSNDNVSYFDSNAGTWLTQSPTEERKINKSVSMPTKKINVGPKPQKTSTTLTPTKPKIARQDMNDLTFRQRKWNEKIVQLEYEREEKQRSVRQVGKVLDSTKIADRNISILARTSSSISLRWQQGKFLGGGSFGNVYLGINLDTADIMAVKEIRFSDVTHLDKLQQSITDEMEVLRVLHHKDVIEYYGVEVYRDRIYIFMEYCPYSLSGMLERGRMENELLVAILAKQMLQGLEYLHLNGVVHRDVKPANVLIGQDFNIKIVDFGASKMFKAQKTVVVSNGTTNTLVGTPQYIAPEIITNDGLGKAGLQDIWSLGCCILEMVTGKKPWAPLDNEWAIMYHIGIAGQTPELPSDSLVSLDCIDFIKKCFTRPAADRPSASDLLQHPWIVNIDESSIEVSEEITKIMDKSVYRASEHNHESDDVITSNQQTPSQPHTPQQQILTPDNTLPEAIGIVESQVKTIVNTDISKPFNSEINGISNAND